MAPYQPRLDWQMWFAALGSCEDAPWLPTFMVRLLEGSPAVWALMGDRPSPVERPRLLRAVRYQYRFTSPAERRAGGAWWRREREGLACPTLLLTGNGVVATDWPPRFAPSSAPPP